MTQSMRLTVAGAVAGALAIFSVPVIAGVYTISGKNGVVIDGATFSNAGGHCVHVINSTNVTIRNSYLAHCKDAAIRIDGSRNVLIENSQMAYSGWGVLAVDSSAIQVYGSRFRNMRARGVPGDRSGGTFVQFYHVTGGGNRIINNRGINEIGNSDAEDLVAIGYRSAGLPADPILVSGNCFKGGGPSRTGGGIMTGDEGSAHVVVRNNTLVDPGQYGVAIAGGTNIQLLNNRIYGRRQSFTNVGLYVWNQNAARCGGHSVYGNAVQFNGSSGASNPAWNSGNCGSVYGWSTNTWNANLATLDCRL